MDFIEQFFGNHTIGFHAAGILFCLMGALLVKRAYWIKHKAQLEGVSEVPKFNYSKWLSANWIDLLTAIGVAFVFVRFVEIFLEAINVNAIKIGTFEIPVTGDLVFYYLLWGGIAQIFMHKWAKKKRLLVHG